MRNTAQRLQNECRPRQEPEQHQSPEKPQRDCVIVSREALVEIPQEMFVDKVEPEKSFGLPLRGVAETREQMPRRGNRQKNQKARKQMQLEQTAQVSREQQEYKNCPNGKDQPDQPFGQDIQGHGCGDAPAGPA